LRSAKISPAAIQGYEKEENTHFGVASCVADDQADVGIGVQSAAHRMGLDFIPLYNERYDLVALHEVSKTEVWKKILSILNSSAFQIAVQRQVGYDTSLTGKVMFQTGL
jgi:putative molybdopterin biosynthesis protein